MLLLQRVCLERNKSKERKSIFFYIIINNAHYVSIGKNLAKIVLPHLNFMTAQGVYVKAPINNIFC